MDAARAHDPDVPQLDEMRQLSFREELHAIEAAAAGQGIAVSSDILLAEPLEAGTLIKATEFSIPGYGYYVTHVKDAPRQPLIDGFSGWARSIR